MNNRFDIPVDGRCGVQAFTAYKGALPGLLITDGNTEMIFTAGPRNQDAYQAKEWAISLASRALIFADRCNQRLMKTHLGWPEDDPECQV